MRDAVAASDQGNFMHEHLSNLATKKTKSRDRQDEISLDRREAKLGAESDGCEKRR